MKYSQVLDRTTVSGTQLDLLFTELKDYFNTAKLRARTFEKGAIEYRHLAGPPVISLMSEPAPLATGATPYGGWYPVTNHKILHQATIDNAPNANQTGNYPVLEVSGAVGFVGASRPWAHPGVPGRVCLGVSVNAGATWNPLDGSGGTQNTARPLGDTCGRTLAYYDSPTQAHYIYGTANYRPIDYQSDRTVHVLAAFGGDLWNAGPPSALNAYCLMIDGQQTNTCQGWGWIELVAREVGF